MTIKALFLALVIPIRGVHMRERITRKFLVNLLRICLKVNAGRKEVKEGEKEGGREEGREFILHTTDQEKPFLPSDLVRLLYP